MKLTTLLSVVTIMIMSLIGIGALFHPGFYTSHDGEHQLVRQYVFDQGLRDGQIPVRFSRQLYHGYGYPLFMFTYRLPFYIGEIFRLIGFTYVDSIKAVFGLTYLLSGLTMFWFAKRWGTAAGLLASLLYLWAPYRFSVMFVRAALGEQAAFVFIPLLFMSIDDHIPRMKQVILGATATAGIILSHAMVAQILLLPVSIWTISRLWLSKDRWRFIRRLLAIFLLGIGLSAYYLIPATAYRPLTQKLNPLFYADHFVTLRQLIYSPWGFAFSMNGIENDGMSFQVGIAQWFVVALSALWLIVHLTHWTHKTHRSHASLLSLLIIFILSIFLMTESSSFLWERWRHAINIDMPWRFLSVTTFTSSAMAAVAYKSYESNKTYRSYHHLIALLVLALAFYSNRNHLRVNKYIDYPDGKLYTYTGTSNTENEYRPKWDNINQAKSVPPPAEVVAGDSSLSLIRSWSNYVALAMFASIPSRVQINTLYFPGWNVFIDGQPTPFKYDGEGGIMRVEVPGGYHLVEARYQETKLAKMTDMISIVALIVISVLIFRYSKLGLYLQNLKTQNLNVVPSPKRSGASATKLQLKT